MSEPVVDWVSEVPAKRHSSPYDAVARRVHETGEIARIKAKKKSVHTTASRLRTREAFKGLLVESRTIPDEDEAFIFVSRKEK